MRVGPSGPAGRSRFQTTFGGFGQKPWSLAQKEKAWEEPGQVTGKKRTAREPLMTCRKRRNDVETVGVSLTVGALSADASIRSITGPMGSSEIQEAARPSAQGDALGRAYLETRSEVVGALADGSAAWFHGGSRVS